MNKIKNLLVKFTSFAIILTFVFALTSCKKKVSVSITTEKDSIVYGERLKLNANVTGAKNNFVTWDISSDIVTISHDNYLSVTQKISSDTKVTITATSVEDTNTKATKEITVIAPKIDVTLDQSSLKENESATITVNVAGLLNKEYKLTLSDDSVVKLEDHKITVTQDVVFPKSIIVTATSVEDNTIVGKATIDIVPKDTGIVKMSIASSADQIKKGETVTFSVEVTGNEDTTYTWSVNYPDIVKIENNVLSVIADIKLDKLVLVTATSNANPNVFVSKSILVKAPQVEGQVGELTSTMLQKISNKSITVSGKLTDIYQDFNQPVNNYETSYNMEVKMEDGAWSGTWEIDGVESTKLTDSYRRSEKDGYVDQNGITGHALERVYINKNNQVAREVVKNYMSITAVWEAQHLWNHLDNLNINKFQYDPENEVYEYVPEVDAYGYFTEEEAFFLTYLAVSLTPMLSDTINKLYLVVEDGEITKLLAQTEVMYYGGTENNDADAMSYTTIAVSFSNIGTTVVENPEPFEAPQYAELLASALEKMHNAKNYTFQATDTTTAAPSTDDSDYELLSTTNVGLKSRVNPFVKANPKGKLYNYTSSVGTVGCYGQVTEDAVIYATTTKYTYSMDGKNYLTKYSGLKQNNDNSYDLFEYNSSLDAFEGTKKVSGNIFDAMPKFDFSANIFKFLGSSFMNGKTTYTFELRETSIIREVAMQVSAYNLASNGEATIDTSLRIVVDENGNLVSTTYPYSINYGTYRGVVTTTYSKFGTTTLPEDAFTGYVQREVKTDWNQYTCKYYSPNFSTQTSREENALVVLQSIFGDDYVDVPSPALFLEIMGDNIYGPFYDWKSIGKDSDGNDINRGYMTIKTTSSNFDENAKILDYEELMEKFKVALENEGFTLSVGNTDMSGGKTGRSDRYVCYIKDNVQIVISNNHTKYIDISFYITGDWILKR